MFRTFIVQELFTKFVLIIYLLTCLLLQFNTLSFNDFLKKRFENK